MWKNEIGWVRDNGRGEFFFLPYSLTINLTIHNTNVYMYYLGNLKQKNNDQTDKINSQNTIQ